MRAQRWAAVALLLSVIFIDSPKVSAQVFTTGEGVCKLCGHSELDTQRYVNSFLNQLFFPNTLGRRAGIATSLYMLTATFTMSGSRSPDPGLSSVTIAITAEVEKALPTGRYRITVTTQGGKTSTDTYAIGGTRFNVHHKYKPGAVKKTAPVVGTRNSGHSGPPARSIGSGAGSRGPARCSRSRFEARGNETISWCSVD